MVMKIELAPVSHNSPELEEQYIQEAVLYEKLENGKVRCNICQRRCSIAEGKRGWCLTRINRGGKLYSLIYGRVSTMMVSPIEKKPVFHFYPGSRWLSIGSLGCNFRCPGCQNWDIAHDRIQEIDSKTEFIHPERLIQIAKKENSRGISWTYNEPTLWFEYTLEGAKLAKAENLSTNYVTNGFITPEALDLIGPYLDVFRVDIKGFSNRTYNLIAQIQDFSGILEVVQLAKKKYGMWVEVVTNIIPGYNDDERELKAIAEWIAEALGAETPWHVTRFFPHLKLSNLNPTPSETLLKARRIGLNARLKYVYLGNMPDFEGEDTYCPKCGKIVVKRSGFLRVENRIKDNKCPFCGERIAGHFMPTF